MWRHADITQSSLLINIRRKTLQQKTGNVLHKWPECVAIQQSKAKVKRYRTILGNSVIRAVCQCSNFLGRYDLLLVFYSDHTSR